MALCRMSYPQYASCYVSLYLNIHLSEQKENFLSKEIAYEQAPWPGVEDGGRWGRGGGEGGGERGKGAKALTP